VSNFLTTKEQSMSETKAWWASKTVWATLIMLAGVGLRSVGIDIGPFEGELTDTALTVVTVVAGAVGLWGRITATALITR
jgi:hypothetical protein